MAISALLLFAETTLLLSVAAYYIVNCPFTKVEESFNVQAIHDIINIFPRNLPLNFNSTHYLNSQPKYYDDKIEPPSQFLEIAERSTLPWDHTLFPGIVPRTFIGALIVAIPMRLAKYLMLGDWLDIDEHQVDEHDFTAQFILQLGSRFALASIFVLSLSILLRAIGRRYGLTYRICFLLITSSQFHYLFYAGRFIPNTFASILSNLVFASWITRQYSKSVVYIAICVMIFRFDTAVFFGWLLIDGIFIRRFLTLGRVLQVGIPVGLISILVTITIDSIFWGQLVWPEFTSFYFNAWLNKSHLWGVEPYFWYIYSCVPRLMLASAPLLILAEHKFTREYLIPTLVFIFTYSLLPHKELRFILFVIPFFNLCAASGLLNLYYCINKTFVIIQSQLRRHKDESCQVRSPRKGKKLSVADRECEPKSLIALVIFGLIVSVIVTSNVLACFVMTRVSSYNYPGGQAAVSLGVTKELLDNARKSDLNIKDFGSNVGIYVNNLAAQTGVTRFTQVNRVYYSKTPNLDETTFRKSYDLSYLILEPKEVSGYLRLFCPRDKNLDKFLQSEDNQFSRGDDELKCQLPNQSQTFCSIVDTIGSFKSVNIGALLRQIRQIRSIRSALESFNDQTYIKTQTALLLIRCSTRSKFNPLPQNN